MRVGALRAGLAALSLTLITSWPATGAAETAQGMSVAEIAEIFAANGLPAAIERDGSGEAMIVSETGGLSFLVYGYACAAARCREFLFSAAFEMRERVELDVVNAFNGATLAGRAYIDSGGEAVLEHFFSAPRADRALVERNLEVWETILPDFARHIGYFDGPVS